ncbi:MAG: putative capsular polysaccharide synthesis family protein [Gammaproteobacteria bacterium]
MGKVGSTSVYHSLRKACLNTAVYHIHVLTKEGIRWEEEAYFGKSRRFFHKSGLLAKPGLFQSHYLYKQLSRNKQSTRWKIITLVRDPIARNVSGLFSTIERWIPDFYDRYSRKAIDTDELAEIFLHDYHGRIDSYEFPFHWFSAELQPVFGIDVLSSEFPKSVGYKIYKSESIDLLLIKLEYLNQCFPAAIKEFLGFDIPLTSANVAADKSYYPLYQEFTRALKLPDAYIEQQYSCNYVRHFYSESEIDTFIKKWVKIGPLVQSV